MLVVVLLADEVPAIRVDLLAGSYLLGVLGVPKSLIGPLVVLLRSIMLYAAHWLAQAKNTQYKRPTHNIEDRYI